MGGLKEKSEKELDEQAIQFDDENLIMPEYTSEYCVRRKIGKNLTFARVIYYIIKYIHNEKNPVVYIGDISKNIHHVRANIEKYLNFLILHGYLEKKSLSQNFAEIIPTKNDGKPKILGLWKQAYEKCKEHSGEIR